MIMRVARHVLLLGCLAISVTRVVQAAEEPFQLTCRDGFVLDGKIGTPDGEHEGPEKVIILLHGSGPQSMDVDLTAITQDGKQNLLFKELSDSLVAGGFTVVRYHKRTHQCNLKIAEDRSFVQSEQFQRFADNWLKLFVDDAMDCARYVRETHPEAEVFYLGHSQGCYVALQAAHQLDFIKGVALVGFYLGGMETAVLEQTVYRPLRMFRALDANQDDSLDAEELAADDPIAGRLRQQMKIVDQDGDGAISDAEFKAGNLSNLLVLDLGLSGYTRQEATYPRQADILRDATFNVIFLQGLWDNQTPAYHTQAAQLAARQVWKKDTMRFVFFPELGHALDRRDSYDDLTFDTIDADAKQKLVEELREFFELESGR